MDPATGVRLWLSAWRPLCRIEGQYIERPRSLRMVWAYLRHLGPGSVIRKVRSRLAEGKRNNKVVALGTGVVLDAGSEAGFECGDAVVFMAPNHPETPARDVITLDFRFVRAKAWLREVRPGSTEDSVSGENLSDTFKPWAGWSPFSGFMPDAQELEAALRTAIPQLERLVEKASTLTQSEDLPPPVSERVGMAPKRKSEKSAVIFGLGNYAKTQIVPIVGRELDLACIHEIDPDQFAAISGQNLSMDSSPVPREGEGYDAWFIAGYHHTHAPLAVEALKRGAYAVVEKPLATTPKQFDELTRTLASALAPRLFSCFQKRYSELHEWAREDLACGSGESVDMYASVYEIPLPRGHWYNWSVSGSRMISNGCHWLDYFMFVNGYAEVEEADVASMRNSDLLATVCLKNGARLVLSLTDTGSARLGVRELIELRHGITTVRIADARRYESENTSRVLRRRSVNPVRAYEHMYKEICRRIKSDGPADSPESLRSTKLMLRLERQLHSKH